MRARKHPSPHPALTGPALPGGGDRCGDASHTVWLRNTHIPIKRRVKPPSAHSLAQSINSRWLLCLRRETVTPRPDAASALRELVTRTLEGRLTAAATPTTGPRDLRTQLSASPREARPASGGAGRDRLQHRHNHRRQWRPGCPPPGFPGVPSAVQGKQPGPGLCGDQLEDKRTPLRAVSHPAKDSSAHF